MNFHQFKKLRVVISALTAMIMSVAVTSNNWGLAIAGVLIGMLIMYVAKKRVKDILADERDYYIAGKAARYALAIFCIIGAVLIFYFLISDTNTNSEIIGSVLAYSVCGLLLLNSILVIYFQRHEK